MLMSVFLAAAAAAVPQPTAEQDVRCLVLMSAVAGSATDPQAKQGGMFGTLIWYGRLSARLSAEEINAAVKREVATMNKELATSEGQRCSQEMIGYGKAMQGLGEEMKAADPAKPAK